MKRIVVLWTLCAGLLLTAAGGETETLRAKAVSLLTKDLAARHVEYLASDDLEGRKAGYPGCAKAEEYIAKQYAEAGLKPFGDPLPGKKDERGFYQQFSLPKGLKTRNCLALYEGNDPVLKDEVIVIGAHHDHIGTSDHENLQQLGQASSRDSIWNGADDNASGTSVVLLLARAIAESKFPLRRSVLFATFSAEEGGLLGSDYYTKTMVFPRHKHVLMINLDMVGRNPDREIVVQGMNSAEGGVLTTIVQKAVEETGLKARLRGDLEIDGGDSDHSSFIEKRIPAIFFFSGYHPDYHRITDHADKVSPDRIAEVAEAVFGIVEAAANRDEPLHFAGTFKIPKLRKPGEAPGADKPRLGVVAEVVDGVLRVDDVLPGSPAEKADIRRGDTILEFGGKSMSTPDALKLMKIILKDLQVGAKINVALLRDQRQVDVVIEWK